jgi:anti-anti-sigma factor
MKTGKRLSADTLYYEVKGDLSLGDFIKVDAMCNEIKEASKEGICNFIWNLGSAGIIDSTGLSVIALTIANSVRNGGKVFIFGESSQNSKVLKLTRMSNNINFCSGLNFALEKISASLSGEITEDIA